ncbi:MAG TPA: hypothetical protein VGG72_30275 [Bryobacteraceae bacterium]|jgi:hypothetical protein
MSFQLTDQNDTLVLDLAGNVTKAGAALGTWTVTKDNQIEIDQTAGGTQTIPVNWSFNGNNELTLAQPNTQNSFNFFADDNVEPALTTDKAVLTVKPDGSADFSFELRPVWKLETNFDMTVTIGTTQSTIDGILGNRQDSGFDYTFQTNDDLLAAYTLNFTGTWKQQTAGNTDLIFEYDTEPDANGNTTQEFDLPDGLDVDSTKNILVYRANKNDQTSEIGLIGTLTLGADFNITYEIDQQDVGGVKTSTFEVEANLVDSSVGTATLDLKVTNSGGTKTFSISGTYNGQIDNAKLTVGFTYTRQKGGGVDTTTVAFNGEVKTTNDDFVWSISKTGDELTISASVTFAVGTTCGEAALNFQTGQGQVAVTAMFSISTGCHPATAQPQAAGASGSS